MRSLSSSVRGLWRRFRDNERGITAVEVALTMPVLLTIVVGIAEVGRAVAQASAVEKGVRAGAIFAARHDMPLDATTKTAVENVVKTGLPSGSGPLRVSGFALPGASVVIDDTLTYTVDGLNYPKVRVTATVPFDSMLNDFVPVSMFTIRLSHEQTHLGN